LVLWKASPSSYLSLPERQIGPNESHAFATGEVRENLSIEIYLIKAKFHTFEKRMFYFFEEKKIS